MECNTAKLEIENTFSDVRNLSYTEKTSNVFDEQKINYFLDKINLFREELTNKTKELSSINIRLEKLTWVNDLDDECMRLLNDLISVARDLHSSLVRHYVALSDIRRKGIAKDLIKEFKSEIDDFKENYIDLEMVFFFLPESDDFNETTNLLSIV